MRWPATTRPDADDPALAGDEIALDVAVVMMPVEAGHQYLDVFADHLAAIVAELPDRCRAEGLDPAALVDHDDGVGDRLKNGAQMSLADRVGLFGLELFGDVAQDERISAGAAGLGLHGCDRELRGERGPVPAPADALRLGPAGLLRRGEQGGCRARIRGNEEACEVAAQNLGPAPPRDLFGAGVPASDPARLVDESQADSRHRLDEDLSPFRRFDLTAQKQALLPAPGSRFIRVSAKSSGKMRSSCLAFGVSAGLPPMRHDLPRAVMHGNQRGRRSVAAAGCRKAP